MMITASPNDSGERDDEPETDGSEIAQELKRAREASEDAPRSQKGFRGHASGGSGGPGTKS